MKIVELMYGIFFIVIGLSHIVFAKEWALLFRDLKNLKYGGLVNGLFSFVSGMIIVLLHNNWGLNIGVITTLYGWLLTLKGVKYLLVPGSFKYKYQEDKTPKGFKLIGLIMLIIGPIMICGYLIG